MEEMTFNTDKQENAWKLSMKVLGQLGRCGKSKLTRQLAHPEYGPYENMTDAKNFVKQLVQADLVEGKANVFQEKGNFIERKDIAKEVPL